MVYLLLHFNILIIYLFLSLDFKAVCTHYLADTLFYIFLYKCICKFRIVSVFCSDYVLQMLYFKRL